MKRKIIIVMKTGLILSLLALVSLVVVYKVMAAPTDDEFLLRVEVQSHNGDLVSVSAPLALLNTLFNLMPKDILRLCDDVKLTPEQIIKEVTNLQGNDLVHITGQDNIRVWFAPISSENHADLGYIKVHVKEGGEHGNDINVCVPRGLVQLAGSIVKSLGLVDKYVELPPEIKNLKVIANAN